ncbi:hypothetical protein H6503_03310 [Candidatus Woesearchaeota archaeon]|nr:hypothetical protein [Candidatus Woesearchaeota archaeon]
MDKMIREVNKINLRRMDSKKAIVYTGTTVLFLMVLLVFAVAVYNNKEVSKVAVIPNSLANRMISIEDSMQWSIKKIYEVNKNLTLDIDTVLQGGEYVDITSVQTVLLENGPSKDKFIADMNGLEGNYTKLFPDVQINLTSILDDPMIKRSGGIGINKTATDLSTTSNETLQLYYNYSHLTTSKIIGFEVNITSTDPITDISFDTTPSASGVKDINFNLTINDLDFPDFLNDPERIEASTEFSFSSGDINIIYVNNTTTAINYINISFDDEVINITTMSGNYNVSVKILTPVATTTHNWEFPYEVFNISIPSYHALSRSRVIFR